jgi:hypothetical protein
MTDAHLPLLTEEMYRPALAKDKSDYCIEADGGVLTIGYGNGGVVPQAFFVATGEKIAVTYLKIFMSSKRLDLSCISQGSPFESARPCRGGRMGGMPEIWDSYMIEVVQRPHARSRKPYVIRL